MKSLFANVNLFLFICIVVHIATDVAAQQSPVSLLPKAQRTFELDKKLPQQETEIESYVIGGIKQDVEKDQFKKFKL